MVLAGWFCNFVAWRDPVGGVGWIEMSQKESVGVAKCVICGQNWEDHSGQDSGLIVQGGNL